MIASSILFYIRICRPVLSEKKQPRFFPHDMIQLRILHLVLKQHLAEAPGDENRIMWVVSCIAYNFWQCQLYIFAKVA